MYSDGFLLVKLSTYRFNYNSLKLINSFLSAKKIKMKIDTPSSPYLHLLVGVPRSVLGHLLFNIYMCSLFLSDWMQMTLPYILVNQIWSLYWISLRKKSLTVFTMFQNNYLKAISGNSSFNNNWQCLEC